MSKLYTIKNECLTATFCDSGAELHSLKDKNGKEYIFRDLNVWGFSAPTLFPICGGLKDDKYIYNGKEYHLEKHGYTRTAQFTVEDVSDSAITFICKDTEETRKCYPFNYELRIIYTLEGMSLKVRYSVTNTGNEDMPYSIGCHEAYLCPEGIDKYTVIFDEKETLDTHLVRGNLLDYETKNIITDSDRLALNYPMFADDALVFSKFNSSAVELAANDGSRRIRVEFPEFSHLLFWTTFTVDAPYLCIEPWCGCPDMIDSVYDITKRPGILTVKPGEVSVRDHKITVLA